MIRSLTMKGNQVVAGLRLVTVSCVEITRRSLVQLRGIVVVFCASELMACWLIHLQTWLGSTDWCLAPLSQILNDRMGTFSYAWRISRYIICRRYAHMGRVYTASVKVASTVQSRQGMYLTSLDCGAQKVSMVVRLSGIILRAYLSLSLRQSW